MQALLGIFFPKCVGSKFSFLRAIMKCVWLTLLLHSHIGRFDRNNTGGASVFNFFHNEDEVWQFSKKNYVGRGGTYLAQMSPIDEVCSGK